MNASVKASTLEPLLHPGDAAKILNVSMSWLAKARLSGEGPRFVKIGRAVQPARVHQGTDAGIDKRAVVERVNRQRRESPHPRALALFLNQRNDRLSLYINIHQDE
jgi:hypothetical protein